MLTFRQYITEIFRQQGTYSIDQSNHPDLLSRRRRVLLGFDDNDIDRLYEYTPKNAKGEPITSQRIRTFFEKTEKNSWAVTFSVGGATRTKGEAHFPSHVTQKVFDHFKHFVDTTKQLSGKAPHIQYDTTHPKKHRIYQAVAKRLGVTAENMVGWLDDELNEVGQSGSR